jgi:dihydrofolate reductase
MVNYEGKQLMKLVVTEYISLDGVVENPIWIAPYFDADFLKFKFDELMGGDALLMGRHTYDYFIPTWATDQPVEDAPGQEGFAERLDQLPKHVVSSTLKNPVWNNTLMQHRLVDEYRFLLYPLMVGSGKRFFEGQIDGALTLVESKAFSTGVIALTYRPAAER